MSTPLNGSILKAFEILQLVSRDRPELTASVVRDELGMTTATAHRLLATLEEAGALMALRRGVYRLSLATAEMGRVAEATNALVPHVQPRLDALRTELNESVMACRQSRAGPACVCVAPADRPIAVTIRPGAVLNFVTSAQGKLWLAHMDADSRAEILARDGKEVDADALERELATIRAEGVARNLGGAEPDIAAVAAPVRGARGEVMLTISVFGPLSRFAPGFQDRARDAVIAAAREIEARLKA